MKIKHGKLYLIKSTPLYSGIPEPEPQWIVARMHDYGYGPTWVEHHAVNCGMEQVNVTEILDVIPETIYTDDGVLINANS